MASTKGHCFTTFLKCLKKLHGEAAVPATLERLQEPLKGQLATGTLFGATWYPLESYGQLHRAAQAAVSRGRELSYAIGFESTLVDINGIYRVFLRVLSPEYLVSKSAQLWSQYYDVGTLSVVESRPGLVRARWAGCAGFDANLWSEAAGGAAGALSAAGAVQPRAEITAGGGNGDTGMDAALTWRV